MFRLTLLFRLVLLTQLDAPEEEAAPLSAGRMRDVLGVVLTWEKMSPGAAEEMQLLILALAQDVTESRLHRPLFCLSEIAASSVIRDKMFDCSGTGNVNCTFKIGSFANQTPAGHTA